jgi:hypothetical protein
MRKLKMSVMSSDVYGGLRGTMAANSGGVSIGFVDFAGVVDGVMNPLMMLVERIDTWNTIRWGRWILTMMVKVARMIVDKPA